MFNVACSVCTLVCRAVLGVSAVIGVQWSSQFRTKKQSCSQKIVSWWALLHAAVSQEGQRSEGVEVEMGIGSWCPPHQPTRGCGGALVQSLWSMAPCLFCMNTPLPSCHPTIRAHVP